MTMIFYRDDVVALKHDMSRTFVVTAGAAAAHTIEVIDKKGDVHNFSLEDLVIITPTPTPGKLSPEGIYKALNEHIVELINEARNVRGVDKTITLEIKAKNYPGAQNVDVSYEAYVDTSETVCSRSLARSLQIATDRFHENAAVKPLSLPRY